MRLIVDQQLPPVLADWFRDRGQDAVHVRELGLSTAPDTMIWTEASRDDAAIVSRDEDFVQLARGGGARLVWVRVGNCDNPRLLAMVKAHWPAILRRLEDGDGLVELRST